MRLKRLTLMGFKSFADKTELEFQPGVTIIVGPNGCGKSNIADAIRWVLGEQSAKALRGSSMADVIFNGTETRKSLGMAEVSLTIEGIEPDQLRTAGISLDYQELTVTRRVYRDGRSEYLINQVPCRLRDIQALFAGTGMGRPAYSILAQGNITQILSSKPDERRIVFEEAAGITRFKMQKREALRRLEQTEQNLLRLNDLIQEVQRRLNSLQRQASKARRYRRFTDRLKIFETVTALRQWEKFQEQFKQQEARLEEARREWEAVKEALGQREQQWQECRSQYQRLQNQIKELDKTILKKQGEQARYQQRVEFLEQRLEDSTKQKQRAEQEIERLRHEIGRLGTELTTALQRVKELEAEYRGLEQQSQSYQQSLKTYTGRLEQLRKTQKDLQTRLFDRAREAAALRNRIRTVETEEKRILGRRERLRQEKDRVESEYRTTREKLEQAEREEQRLAHSVHDLEQRIEQEQETLQALTLRAEKAAARLEALDAILQEVKTRQEQLIRQERDRVGYSEGVRKALQERPEVKGVLADFIEPDPDLIFPLQAILGPLLEALIVPESTMAREVAEKLGQDNPTRTTLAWIQEQNPDPYHLITLSQATAALNQFPHQPFLALVPVQSELRPLFSRLLQRVYLVPDLETAWAANQATDGWFIFVTPGGEVVSGKGTITVGHGQNQWHGSVLERKAELRRLEERCKEEQAKRSATAAELEQLHHAQQEQRIRWETDRAELQKLEGLWKEAQERVRQLRQAEETAAHRLKALEFELENLSRQSEELQQEQENLAKQLATAGAEERDLEEQLSQIHQALETLEQEREKAHQQWAEFQAQIQTKKQAWQSAQQRPQELQRRLLSLQKALEQRQNWLEEADRNARTAHAEIATVHEQMIHLKQEIASLLQLRQQTEQEQDTVHQHLQRLEAELQQQRRQQEELQEQRSSLELSVSEKRMALQNLTDRFREKYALDLATLQSEHLLDSLFPEGKPDEEEDELREWLAEAHQAADDTLENEIQYLQERIRAMGEVNLVAIEEFEETQQRRQFLTEQYEDLVEAKKQLTHLIGRINAETRAMFLDTFEKIRRSFRELFVEVFGGGRADLYLVDENDVLESGIEIVARPPGKPSQSIQLLSGGEQTMTAVALLFAIYQIRPSPFCVLDELDAALDEANIDRFIRILRRFLDRSQFIIITHNKRTIAMGDVIFGVTMEERGVSKIVSVRLEKATSEPRHGIEDRVIPLPG